MALTKKAKEALLRQLFELAAILDMPMDTDSGEVVILTGIAPQEIDRILGWK